jgi:hypothetical protein
MSSASRAEARFVGAPPHAFISARSRAIDNTVSVPTGSHTAERQKAASALPFGLARYGNGYAKARANRAIRCFPASAVAYSVATASST